jgi:hypothetical protein
MSSVSGERFPIQREGDNEPFPNGVTKPVESRVTIRDRVGQMIAKALCRKGKPGEQD